MASFVRALAYLHIAFGACGVLIGGGLFLLFGGLAGATAHGSSFLAGLFGIVAVFLLGLLVLLSIPGIIAGFGLLNFRPWARILTIVLCALELLHFPFGTALGAFGLWVLLNPESEHLFRQ